jgi:magnesium transporter
MNMNKNRRTHIREYRGRRTRWIHVGDANITNIRLLGGRFPIHEHDLRELLPAINHTKCVVRPGYIFLVLVFPIYDRAERTVKESELHVFIDKDTLVTVNHGSMLPDVIALEDDMSNAARRELVLSQQPADVLLSLLDRIYRSTFPILVQLSHDIHDIEASLFKHYDREEMIHKLLTTKSGNARARSAMQNHRYALRELNSCVANFHRSPLAHFHHIVSQTMDIWNTLESQREAINTIHETNETLLSYKTNKIMKTLTIFTSILLPLSFIADLLKIHAPLTTSFNELPWGFPSTLTVMAMLSAVMLYVFKRKKWM